MQSKKSLFDSEQPHFGNDLDLLIIVSKRSKNYFEIIYSTLFNISLEYEWFPLILFEDSIKYLRNICQ